MDGDVIAIIIIISIIWTSYLSTDGGVCVWACFRRAWRVELAVAAVKGGSYTVCSHWGFKGSQTCPPHLTLSLLEAASILLMVQISRLNTHSPEQSQWDDSILIIWDMKSGFHVPNYSFFFEFSFLLDS